MRKIRALIVEDSPVVQEHLRHILTSDPDIEVIAIAANGIEALEAVKQYCPDVITMDIHMPKMDGFEATKQIMQTMPTPIVIVSGSAQATEVAYTFRAVEAGALAVTLRPPGISHGLFETASRELIQLVKLMSEIRVVRRIPHMARPDSTPVQNMVKPSMPLMPIQAIVIGASTGGPTALLKLLSNLAADFPVPIIMVQHIAPGFVQGFAEWLSNTSHFPVGIANHNERPSPGHAYIAPDGYHIGLGPGPRIFLDNGPPEGGLRPSAGFLFRSAAKFMGAQAAGILLTGMGKDGAEELRLMRDSGAITFAQDQDSSIVYGMPAEAVRLDAAMHVLPPEHIAAMLNSLMKKEKGLSNEHPCK